MKRKLDYEAIRELWEKQNSCEKIAVLLNYSISGVYNAVKSMNLIREYKLCENIPIELTLVQKNVLIGSLLGDAHMNLQRKNPWVKFEHGKSQYKYILWKHAIFYNLGSSLTYNVRKTPDKRTGNIYSSYSFYLSSNPTFLSIYYNCYKNKKKVISKELLKDYNELSLAVHIMDDGSRSGKRIILNTQSFSEQDVKLLQEHLNLKFGIISKIQFQRKLPILVISSSSLDLINHLISKYIIEEMKYKVS